MNLLHNEDFFEAKKLVSIEFSLQVSRSWMISFQVKPCQERYHNILVMDDFNTNETLSK